MRLRQSKSKFPNRVHDKKRPCLLKQGLCRIPGDEPVPVIGFAAGLWLWWL